MASIERAPTCRDCGEGVMTLATDGAVECPECGARYDPFEV